MLRQRPSWRHVVHPHVVLALPSRPNRKVERRLRLHRFYEVRGDLPGTVRRESTQLLVALLSDGGRTAELGTVEQGRPEEGEEAPRRREEEPKQLVRLGPCASSLSVAIARLV